MKKNLALLALFSCLLSIGPSIKAIATPGKNATAIKTLESKVQSLENILDAFKALLEDTDSARIKLGIKIDDLTIRVKKLENQ